MTLLMRVPCPFLSKSFLNKTAVMIHPGLEWPASPPVRPCLGYILRP